MSRLLRDTEQWTCHTPLWLYSTTMRRLLAVVAALLTARLGEVRAEAMIEEVNDRQLEKLIEENDFVATAWFTKTCK